MKNLHLLKPHEWVYLRTGTLKAYFKRRNMEYMIIVIFGKKD